MISKVGQIRLKFSASYGALDLKTETLQGSYLSATSPN